MNFNQLKGKFTENDVNELVGLLCVRCSKSTKNRMRSILAFNKHIRAHGIYDRIIFDRYWQYIPGQDEVSELRTIRHLIIGG